MAHCFFENMYRAILRQEISISPWQKSIAEIFSRKSFEKFAFFAKNTAKKSTLWVIFPLEEKSAVLILFQNAFGKEKRHLLEEKSFFEKLKWKSFPQKISKTSWENPYDWFYVKKFPFFSDKNQIGEIISRKDYENPLKFAKKAAKRDIMSNFSVRRKIYWHDPFSKYLFRKKDKFWKKSFFQKALYCWFCVKETSNFLWLKSAAEIFSSKRFRKLAFLRKKTAKKIFF